MDELMWIGRVRVGMEFVPGTSSAGDTGVLYYLVKKVAAVTGRDLRNARPPLDENNRPAVSFTLNSEGGRKFGKASGANIGRQLAMLLHRPRQSAPTPAPRTTTARPIRSRFAPDA